ncbi:unnamed protein product [Clavelina lepadiformis]|uniref:Mannose-P-dolichol utilization defect 1 protein homolog n=1 Tax=Clavelina lepadiformis TaxID=159417 RepID=A0ABP0EVA5_CLALP
MLFKQIMNVFMSDECYHLYFVDFNFFDGPCFSAVLSKLLGYAIVLGAVLVKVPQIQKIVSAGSALGVSFFALLLELYAVTSMFSYSLAREFPFSTWGDSFFLLIQNVIIGFLIQYYNGKTATGAVFIGMLAIIVYVLASGLTPLRYLATLQAANMPAVVVSKLVQAFDNYKNGHTGQLSVITVFLLFNGSLARIFTSIQETGDNLIILNYVVSSICNGIIGFQILWYWNATPKEKAE